MLLELRVVRICVRYRFCLEIIIFRWLYRGREKYSEDGGTTFGESRRFEMWFPASAPSVPARQRYTRILHPPYIASSSTHHYIPTTYKMSYTIAGRAIKVSFKGNRSVEHS